MSNIIATTTDKSSIGDQLGVYQQQLIAHWAQKAIQRKDKKSSPLSPKKEKETVLEKMYEQMLKNDDASLCKRLYEAHYFESWNKEQKCYEVNFNKVKKYIKDSIAQGARQVQYQGAPWVLECWHKSHSQQRTAQYTDSEYTRLLIDDYMMDYKKPVPLIDALWHLDEQWMLSQVCGIVRHKNKDCKS